MTLLGRIILGLIGAGIGFVLVRYANWFYANFGSMNFAEKYFRIFGGTRLFVRFIGVIIIFLSFLLITGLLGGFTKVVLSPFLGGR
ncbi:hypothetical protein HOD96_01270 [Candidatus Falkowbacteria bacterium]|jgi:hypothetical protein|nr:hypothetical protein [Candidatus Falkowbacteria bacterium]MBT4433036.1 hypothetical protein [Candidatus Falkowbacteria bacterium]